MSEEDKPFVAFHGYERGKEVLRIEAEKPQRLINKAVENAEVINNLRYDHYTTNIRNFILDEHT